MSLVVRTLSNTGQPLVDASGAPAANINITFQLVDKYRRPVDTLDSVTAETVLSTPVIATTDAQGEFTVNLWPTSRASGDRAYIVSVGDGSPESFIAQLDEGDLSELSWHALKSSAGALENNELSAFELHVQDATSHSGAYTHPTTHPPSIIEQDENNRFVTDAEKEEWSAVLATELPLASVDYRGRILTIEGGDGVSDFVFVCYKKADGSYVWLELITA
jgi:hypothetical protein